VPDWKSRCRCGQPLEFAAYDIATGRPQEGSDYWCSDGDPQTGPHDQGVILDNGIERAIAKSLQRNDCNQCGAPMLGRKCLRCGWVSPRQSEASITSGGAPLPQYDDYYTAKGAFAGSGSSLTIPNIHIGKGNSLYLAILQVDSDGLSGGPTVTWNSQSVPLETGEATSLSLALLRGFLLVNATEGTGSIVITGGGASVVALTTCVCELRNVVTSPLDFGSETGAINNSSSADITSIAHRTGVLISTCARFTSVIPPDALWVDSVTMKQSIVNPVTTGVDGLGQKLYQGAKMAFPGSVHAGVTFGQTNSAIAMVMVSLVIK
jgi:hypothetical protein